MTPSCLAAPTPGSGLRGSSPATQRCYQGSPTSVSTSCAYTFNVCSEVISVPLTMLGLLEREPSHGYELKRDYDAYFGRGRPLPFGQVYATLGRLARDGKVVAGEAEPGAGPERKRYVITEAGATEVETWLAE